MCYFSRILSAGGFKAYERAHREALTQTLSPKLAHLLPPELVAASGGVTSARARHSVSLTRATRS